MWQFYHGRPRNADGPAGHKETLHYQQWRDDVADMMAVPRTPATYRVCLARRLFFRRTAVQYDTVFPGKDTLARDSDSVSCIVLSDKVSAFRHAI